MKVNLVKLICMIVAALWILIVLIQQITWIVNGSYSFAAFVWGIILCIAPYLIYTGIKED